MSRLETLMLSVEAVTYLVNLSVAVSFVCGVGLLAVHASRRGSAPLRHGVMVWTLALILFSPAAVWVAQQNGLALVRLTISSAANTQRASQNYTSVTMTSPPKALTLALSQRARGPAEQSPPRKIPRP
jgi:hypothetical protein